MALQFMTGATNSYTERMRIDSSGNVGIGLTNPSIRLDVVGASNVSATIIKAQGALPDNNDNAGLYVLHQGTTGTGLRVRTDQALTGSNFAHILVNNVSASINGLQVSQYGTGYIASFDKSGTVAMRIDNSGNVGIGTTSPSTYGKLAVVSSTAGGAKISIQDTSAGAAAPLLQFGVNDTNGFNTSDAARIWTIAATSSVASLNFAAYNGGVPSTAQMVLTGGQVGIGTTSPVAKLAVVGGTSNASSLATAYSLAAFNITPKSTSGYSLAFGSGTNDRPYIQMSAAGTAPNDIMIQPYGGSVGIGITVNNVYDAVAAQRPLVVQQSDSSTTLNGSAAAITISNGDTTTNNSAQLNFAAITGASTNQYSSAIISAIFGARTNTQYPTGQLVFSVSSTLNSAPTEKMRIDSSGNVGIGTTSPSVKFQVNHSSDVAAINATGGGVTLKMSNSSANDVLQRMTNNSNNFWDIRNVSSSSNFVIGYNGNDRITIDTSGNVMVGTASLNGTNGFSVAPSTSPYVTLNKTASGGFDGFKFQYNSSGVGSITYTNTAVAFNTSSDYRLKEDIAPITGALAKVAALKPVTYKWKLDGSNSDGFIAHELAEVCPQAVHGEKDAVDADGNPVYQGIDTSFLVATLTAAIQELKALVDTQSSTITALTARIETLENK
jgi:hypothetical protein